MMHMTFYWGISATLLFDQWMTSTLVQYLMSLLVIFLFAIVHEWLYSLRGLLASKKRPSPPRAHDPEISVPLLQKLPVPQNPGVKETLVALLYGINAGTGYLLMLLVMSYNGGVLIAVVLGLVTGFALFRSDVGSGADVCHTG